MLKRVTILLRKRTTIQVLKFSLIGVWNTLLDLGLLNLLCFLTGIYKGTWVFILNSISYSIASANSYILNKFWTFEDRASKREAVKFSKFMVVNVIGLLLNSTVVWSLTYLIAAPFEVLFGPGLMLNSAVIWSLSFYMEAPFGIPPELWLNFSKITATFVVLVWNFVGYKFLVFRKPKDSK